MHFEATSAVCVTGLIADSATELTLFGQIVIISLIQVGGLGFMTIHCNIFITWQEDNSQGTACYAGGIK